MFSALLVRSQPGRWAVLLEALAPLVLLAIASTSRLDASAGARVVGRPPAKAFSVVWTVLGLCLSLALILAAFNLEVASLCTLAVFALGFMISCTLWVLFYQGDRRREANYTLFFAALLALLSLVSAAAAGSTGNARAPLAIALLLTPAVVWTLLACMLGLLELQAR